MSDEWVKAEAQSWNPKETPEIQGELLSIEDGVGQFESTMAMVKKDDGTEHAVWCNTLLADKLRSRVGKYVKIVYTGEQKGKTYPTPYRTYDVFFKDVPMKKVDDVIPQF